MLDKDPEYVGGMARTVRYKNYRFDIGGHRFFSKNAVSRNGGAALGPDLSSRGRASRASTIAASFSIIPSRRERALRPGLFTSVSVLLSYAGASCFPIKPEKSFADWISNRFGGELFSIFFKTYTEKVWGIPCNEISAEWAAQRIKGLSLRSALWQHADAGERAKGRRVASRR